MKKILIANIFGIGDVLFTTPLISNIKMTLRGSEVDYLCNARTKDVIGSNPDVDEVFVYEKDDFVRLWETSKISCIKALWELFTSIRNKKYDAVFDFTLSRKFGLAFLLSGIPKRIGLDYKKRGLFLTNKIPLRGFEKRHVTEYYLDLLRFLDVPKSMNKLELSVTESDLEWAGNHLKGRVKEGVPLIAIIPGGGASWGVRASRKRWTSSGFLKVAELLTAQGDQVMILGDPSEKELCEEIAGKMSSGPVLVENSLTMKEYMALLAKCDLVVCNDGGPLHLAVALGTSTVSVFGPVDEGVYGPYPASEKHRVITVPDLECRPCYNRFKLPECEYDNRCIIDISAERVFKSSLELVSAQRR